MQALDVDAIGTTHLDSISPQQHKYNADARHVSHPAITLGQG